MLAQRLQSIKFYRTNIFLLSSFLDWLAEEKNCPNCKRWIAIALKIMEEFYLFWFSLLELFKPWWKHFSSLDFETATQICWTFSPLKAERNFATISFQNLETLSCNLFSAKSYWFKWGKCPRSWLRPKLMMTWLLWGSDKCNETLK